MSAENLKAYTLGRTSSYDQGLKEKRDLSKLGARMPCEEFPEGYPGGIVFEDKDSALHYKNNFIHLLDSDWKSEDFSVYELLLPNGLEQDITKTKNESGYHNLLNDSLIIRKIENEQIN